MANVDNFKEYTFPWLIFKSGDSKFAINTEKIISISILTNKITPMPHMPHYTRGLMNLRGSVTPLIDSRKLFKMVTLEQELADFSEMIEKRIQDHKDWIEELLFCIKEKREFTLPTSPHECKFGLWYDNYKNPHISNSLRKIDEPHTLLHTQGEELLKKSLEKKNIDIFSETKRVSIALNKTLKYLTECLNETAKSLKESYKEMVVVIENKSSKIGLIVDEVCSVEQITYLYGEESSSTLQENKYISGIGRDEKTGDVLLLVNEAILKDAIKSCEDGELQEPA